MKTKDDVNADYDAMIEMFNRQWDNCPTRLVEYPRNELDDITLAGYEAEAMLYWERHHGGSNTTGVQEYRKRLKEHRNRRR